MRLLVVDDEPSLRRTLSQILAAEGYDVSQASDGEDALARLAEREADLVLCDLRMPRMDGLAMIERYAANGGRGLVIAMSAYGDIETAIEAMRKGAYDYIGKPFRPDEVILAVRKAAERERLRRRVQSLEAELTMLRGNGGLVGRSRALHAAIEVAHKVARHDSTVLITGESGTGKELVARLIHQSSPRAERPFVAVNCAAIPEALLESELFGHAKGAFTGAVGEKAGLFEEAHGGTIFLDEIGDLPQLLQVKLLRVLQEGEVRRVGATAVRTVNVRVVAATNRDLAADVPAGRFRSDLYYRLNVVPIHLPALRERREDIPELALHFLQRFADRLGFDAGGFSPAALRQLATYDWPGNVRELENAVEQALVLSSGTTIEPSHLPESVRRGPVSANGSESPDDLSIKRQRESLERTLIRRALDRTRGNRTRAAQLLELSHRALLYKIREYGLEQ
ncbi:MAG TPA: sigma-54 dependent transcriptional regulator [Gemmatimonadaceae bacterium]|nr:sigma-54 dependent transcriptional regulator [Gemmatimonadaceae bacterium]